jgi:hypothetical protein
LPSRSSFIKNLPRNPVPPIIRIFLFLIESKFVTFINYNLKK